MRVSRKTSRIAVVAAVVLPLLLSAGAGGAVLTNSFSLTANANSPSPISTLAAEATFKLDTAAPTLLEITLKNTTGAGLSGVDNAGQLLTSISFDMGAAGANALDPAIVSGTVVIGPGGQSFNFDNVGGVQLTAGADVTGEWGYGNAGSGGSPLMANIVSAMTSHTTDFGGPNLDGSATNINGPQGGISRNPPLVAIGGIGAVGDSVIISLTLDKPLADLAFLTNDTVVAEFGSDIAFLKGDDEENPEEVPEPATMGLLGLGAMAALLRRRKRRT